jgi:hypothetical protein
MGQKTPKKAQFTPAEKLMRKVLRQTLEPSDARKRRTGLFFPLEHYAKLYQLPLVTIKRIHRRYNPAALDHPTKLLPILMEQPGPRLDLTGMERVIKARFAAGLQDREIEIKK